MLVLVAPLLRFQYEEPALVPLFQLLPRSANYTAHRPACTLKPFYINILIYLFSQIVISALRRKNTNHCGHKLPYSWRGGKSPITP